MIGNNLDNRSECKLIIKSSDVARFHADAAVAGGTTDVLLLRSALDVNAATKGMRVLGFRSRQPTAARNHGIATGSIWRENFPRKPAIMKHGTDRCVVPDFLRDGEVTERSCHSPRIIAHPEHRSGNRISCDLAAIL